MSNYRRHQKTPAKGCGGSLLFREIGLPIREQRSWQFPGCPIARRDLMMTLGQIISCVAHRLYS